MGYKAFWESDHHSDFRNTTQMCCRVPKEIRASGGKESWRRNERRVNRRVRLNPLWCVYFLNDHARSGIGQEEDLEGKGLKSRAALQTQMRKGCFLLIHSSLSPHVGENGEERQCKEGIP